MAKHSNEPKNAMTFSNPGRRIAVMVQAPVTSSRLNILQSPFLRSDREAACASSWEAEDLRLIPGFRLTGVESPASPSESGCDSRILARGDSLTRMLESISVALRRLTIGSIPNNPSTVLCSYTISAMV